VDTGAMYRSVALAANRAGVAWSEAARVGEIARELVAKESLGFERDPQLGVRVKLAGEDVSEAIRTQDISQGASLVSAHREVREALLDLQRIAGKDGGVVLEGRDIGTVVFPDAEVKFFLTASAETRAQRRHAELVAKGQGRSFEETLADVKKRDQQDESREVAPLKQADGAIAIDTTELTIDQTLDRMLVEVKKAPGA
ncbi:MAG TPA: (d)CMP kinase, partial [Labilithrix sp.]